MNALWILCGVACIALPLLFLWLARERRVVIADIDIGGWGFDSTNEQNDMTAVEAMRWAVYRDGQVIALFKDSKDAEAFYQKTDSGDAEERRL